jgi:hypothetical protein
MSRTARLLGSICVVAGMCAIAGLAGAQQASLVGTVLADSTERPLVGAEVAIAALKLAVRTDSSGNFSMLRLPAGSHQVTVRALGHVPYRETVTFGATDRVERDFLLRHAVNTLAEVEVKASVAPVDMRLAEYEARRKLGFGHFITQEVLEKSEGRKLSDVLTSKVPGLHGNNFGNERAIASSRGVLSLQNLPHGDDIDYHSKQARPDCYVQVVVDGMIRYKGVAREKLFDINSIPPEQLAGIEYYTTSQTPPQFNGTGSPCGTLVIWTRMR